jgi:hypothetical protein
VYEEARGEKESRGWGVLTTGHSRDAASGVKDLKESETLASPSLDVPVQRSGRAD